MNLDLGQVSAATAVVVQLLLDGSKAALKTVAVCARARLVLIVRHADWAHAAVCRLVVKHRLSAAQCWVMPLSQWACPCGALSAV